MVVCDAEIEQVACVALDLSAPFVETLGAVEVTLLKLECALFDASVRFDLGGVGRRRVRRRRRCPP